MTSPRVEKQRQVVYTTPAVANQATASNTTAPLFNTKQTQNDNLMGLQIERGKGVNKGVNKGVKSNITATQEFYLQSGRKIVIQKLSDGRSVKKYYSVDGKQLKPEYFKKVEGEVKVTSDGKSYTVTKDGRTKLLKTKTGAEVKIAQQQAILNKTKKEQGFIGKTWDAIKNNVLTFCDSSDKAQNQINAEKKLLQQILQGKVSKKDFKEVTGLECTQENLQKFKNGKLNLKSAEKVSAYKEGQEMAVDVVGDVAAGIGAGIAIAAAPITGGASLALAVAVGAGTKAGIKYLDAKSGGRKYNTLAKDLGTGAITGLLTPVTMGVGGVVGNLSTRVGARIFGQSTVGKIATKTTTFVLREGSIGAVFGGGAEGLGEVGRQGYHAVADGEDFDLGRIYEKTKEGTIGGAVAGILMSGGIKGASKLKTKLLPKKAKTAKTGINYANEPTTVQTTIPKELPKCKFKTADEFKKYLSTFKGNGEHLRYSEEDINSLINMYKENPNFIEYLSLIEDSSLTKSYNVCHIEKLFNLHKTNPEIVEHFILDRNFNGNVYTANDINIYIEATLKNKKLAEELLSRRDYYTTSQIKEIVDNIDSNPKILKIINAKTIDKEGNQVFAYKGNTISDFINGKELKPRQAFLMSIDDNSGNKLLSDQEISELLIQSDGSQRANILIDFCMEHKEYSSILKLFASNVKDRKCYKPDLFYTTDSSGNRVVNRKMCDHLLKLIGKDSGHYSISTPYLENVYELNVVNSHGGKNIRFELSDSGVPIKLEQERITIIGKNKKSVEHIFENGTSIRQEIDYCNYREYSGTETLIGSAHKKEFYDKMGKLLYSEEIIPSSTRSGEYDIVVTRNGKKEIVGCVKQYGSNSQGTRIGRKLISADGTVTKQVKIEGPKGSGSRYIITDSQGNVKLSLKRQHHKISENHYTSRVNNDRYDIRFFEDRIEVTKFDINGKKLKQVELSSEELDFEALELYKKLPGDYFIKLKEMGVKVKKFPHCKEIDQGGGAYCSWEDKLIAFAELDPFVFVHELGHALDMLYLNGLCKDKHLLNIFRQELARYKLNSSATEGHFIDYFTTLKHYSDEGCIVEVIAETNALLSGLSNTASTSTMLGLRSITLQQHFPETIAYIAQKLI